MSQIFHEKLRPCCWCGNKGRINTPDHALWYETLSVYQIRCSSTCYTHTFELHSSCDEAAEAWNKGEVKIPLRVSLPSNHFIKERVPLDPKNDTTKLVVAVTTDRGIATLLKEHLTAVLAYDGTITPSRFALDERGAFHQQVTLESVKSSAYEVDFEFTTRSTIRNVTSKNRSDTVWLKQPPRKPPILLKVMTMLGHEYHD